MMRRKLLSLLLALAMVLALLPAFTKTANAASDDPAAGEPAAEVPADETEAEPTFTLVNVSGDALKGYLEKDGNLKINVTSDIKIQVGKAGDLNAPYMEYWCTLGKGIKVLYLHGHEIAVSYDSFSEGEPTTTKSFSRMSSLFCIGSGAELVVNDEAKNKGKITYKCILKKYKCPHIISRNLFTVKTGGKLTINGGKMIAGRVSEQYYDADMVTYYCQQTNGAAVMIDGGDVTINGGRIEGRGYLSYRARSAAVWLISGSLKVYDGSFYGAGNADCLHIDEAGKVELYGGTYDVGKTDKQLYLSYHSSYRWHESPSYGNIGIPGRAFKNVEKYTRVYKNGTGYLTKDQVAADGTLETSKAVTVTPAENVRPENFEYSKSNGPYTFPGVGVLLWDRNTSLRFLFEHNNYYPRDLRSYDQIEKFECDKCFVAVTTSPEGTDYVTGLYVPSGQNWVDLNDLAASSKDQLEVGKMYYIRMFDTEEWKNSGTSHLITYKENSKLKMMIVEPEEKVPELNIDLEWEGSFTSAGKPQILLTPAGDGIAAKLNELVAQGKIDSYARTLSFYNESNTLVTKTINSATKGYKTTIFRGISTAGFTVDLYRNGKKQGSAQVSKQVICFPDLNADKTVDSSNRILIEDTATDKKVTLSCNANSYSGIFWAKDGSFISNSSNKETYTVDLSNASNVGWYSLGYTLNGTRYFSNQKFYLGIKSTRTLSISTSATSCTINANGNTTPTFTATTSGTGWGTISTYRWQNISWPSGARPSSYNVSTSSNTVTMAKVFGCQGAEASRLVAGSYVFSCIAIDSNGNQTAAGKITVTVSRPVTGLQLWQNVDSSYYDSQNVTGKFIVLKDEDSKEALNVIFTPENADGNLDNVTYSSANTNVATFVNGTVSGTGAGSVTVTATYNSYTASTKVLVPLTKYEITIPEAWLEVEAGAEVHRGEIGFDNSSLPYYAKLSWYSREAYGSQFYEYSGDTFEGNRAYYPMVTIYPDDCVCYPVDIEYRSSYNVYSIDKTRFEITVNGTAYFGATYCSRERNYFYDEEPLVDGSKDYIELAMDPTDVIVDPHDEYLDYVFISLEKPEADSPRDAVGDGVTLLNCMIEHEGVFYYAGNLRHVTDLSTIEDDNYSNDALEDFTTYQEGETYRYMAVLYTSKNYTNSLGGKVHFKENIQVLEPDLGCIVNNDYAAADMVYAYIYFTISMPEPCAWIRVAGSDRYGTMAAASQSAYLDHSCETILIATGQAFPDALAGAALAGVYECPILLTKKTSLTTQTKEEIQRLAADKCKVLILGGNGAVSEAVEKAIKKLGISGLTTERISGSNREETAISVYENGKAAGGFKKGGTVIISTGYAFADVLSISPYAYASKTPILLAKKDGSLSAATKDLIEKEGFSKAIIVGGSKAVSADSEAYLKKQGMTVLRLSGSNRYQTSAKILRWATGNEELGFKPEVTLSVNGMGIATGDKFADALGAVSLLGKIRSPLLLVSDSTNKNAIATQENINDLIKPAADLMELGHIFGGTGAVSAQIEDWLNAVSE